MRNRVLNVLLIAALLLGTLPMVWAPQPAAAAVPTVQPPPDAPGITRNGETLTLQPVTATEIVPMAPGPGEVMYEVKGATGPAIYIIQLVDAPLASYTGDVRGLQATSPVVTGAAKLDVHTPASRAYLNYLTNKRIQFLADAGQLLGRTPEVRHTYAAAYNGLAVTLTPEEAAKVAQLPGVKRVVRNYTRYIETDTSPEYLNAWGIWDGTNTGIYSSTMGEGMLVGIIDTGINMDSPSFAATGDDGYTHTNPLGAGVYTGWCNPAHPSYNPALVCNAKLIGVYSYPSSGNNPEDDHSHGSHTGSTTAGNIVYSPTLPAGIQFNVMSGMAPHANLISYDVCTPAGGCQSDSILAAINDAVVDGVDVINYSIGGGPQSPWGDPDSEGYLAVRNAGIFVATSAGNAGPGAGTVGSPGNAPWLTTVANGTHNRGFEPNGLADLLGGTPPADLPGNGASGEYTARIVHAAAYGNALCGLGNQDNPTNPFAPGTWNGEIVVCDRGTYFLVDKAEHVLEAGAGGVVIANTVDNGTFAIDYGMPGTHLGLAEATLLRAWLVDSNTTVYTATITASPIIHDPALGDIMADGSSRGPNVNANWIKPDIMAPGTNILAAYAGDADAVGLMSGTSMASPHVAGAATLIRAVHPDWTPAEVQSALMMTSWTENLLKEDETTPADPFDVGAGRLDLTGAALAGLVLHETTANFEDADPGAGGDPTTLNLASLANASCLQECSWERTFRNTTGEVVTWTVSFTGDITLAANPAMFTVAAGGTQMVEFTADVVGEPVDAWLFGAVMLTADDAALPELHLPVAVMPTAGLVPEEVVINTRRDAGSQIIAGLQTAEIVTLTTEVFGLAPMETDEFTLGLFADSAGNTFPDIFYANLPSDAYAAWLPVPAGGARLVVEVLNTTSPDLDLLVAYDANGNNVMDLADTDLHDYCQSASGGSWESCDIMLPDAGNWYVILINFAEAVPGVADDVMLGTAVVPGTDAGNMMIAGPASVPALDLYDLTVYWDEPTMEAGDRWYGAFSLGTQPGNEGDIGVIPVTLYRHDDDVVKEASTEGALFGDTVTYTITVQPNVTLEDLTYMLTDTIPAGLTYVPGSAMASEGTVNVVGNQLMWEGLVALPFTGYVASTSATDPNCFNLWDYIPGYVDLQSELGWTTDSGISGDGIAWSYGGFGTYEFYGVPGLDPTFTDDGYVLMGALEYDYTPQDIPDAMTPNDLLAMLWNDFEIVYDAGANRGITAGGIPNTYFIVEFDDIQLFGDPTHTLDMEVEMQPVSDGAPEIVFSFDNINGSFDGTIGVENADGSEGTNVAYGNLDSVISNDLNICFDWTVLTGDPITITYQVTVDAGVTTSPLTNEIVHVVDNAGSLPAVAAFDLYILGDGYKDVSATLIDPGDLVTYTIVLTGGAAAQWDLFDPLPSGLDLVSVDGATYDPGTHSISWSGTLGSGTAMLLTENFDGVTPPALPTGWTTVVVNGTDPELPWITNVGRSWPSGTAHSAPNTGRFRSFSIGATVPQSSRLQLIAPLDLSAITNTSLSFWMYHDSGYSSANDSVQVQISTDGTTWTNVGAAFLRYSATAGWVQHTVDLSGYDSEVAVYLGFLGTSYYGNDCYVDDVILSGDLNTPPHTITLVMEGAIPGYYTNVAHVETQGQHVMFEAPELFVYGAIPTWDKEVWINSMAYNWNDGPFTVVDGDTVTVVDRVKVVFGSPITYTLETAWTPSLDLTDSDASFGAITPGAGMLTWDVISGVSDTWYVFTKTFTVNDYHGFSDLITETLTVEEGGLPQTRVVQFEIPVRSEIMVTPDALSSLQGTDTQVTLPLTITNEGNADLDWLIAPTGVTLKTHAATPQAAPVASNARQVSEKVGATPAASGITPAEAATAFANFTAAQLQDVLYDNGPLVTHPTGGAGGAAASRLQSTSLGMNTLGNNFNQALGITVADDFAVDGLWQVDSLTFYGYQTGSPLNSSFTGLYYRIWDGPPNVVGSSVIYGDLTTNRMVTTTWSGIYRDTETSIGNTQRPIMSITGAGGFTLAHGTYWIEWATTGSLASGPWAPPITILGQTTTGNALQYNGAWVAFTDSGTLTPQGVPFIIEGEQLCGADWLSATPITGTLARDTFETVDVTLDATGLTAGQYTANLCIVSNDPVNPVVLVPATLEVFAEYTLNIETVGNGTVDVDPNQATYLYGDVVTLTATADLGWTFAGWSGDVVTTTNPLMIEIMDDHVITATFTQNEYALDVTIVGNGDVDIDPDQATYHYGDVVTLTATPDTGWLFGSWSGALMGTDPVETLVMDSDKVVTATFVLTEGTFSLTILHTNDVHANVDEFVAGGGMCPSPGHASCIGGAARIATLVNDFRDTTDNLLVLDAGDQFQGTLYYNLFKHEVIAEMMNAIGYDAMAVGNHEFDDGPDELANLADAVNFPILAANIEIKIYTIYLPLVMRNYSGATTVMTPPAGAQAVPGMSLIGKLHPHTIIEVGGQQVAIIGITTPETENISSPGDNIIFHDPIATTQAQVDLLTAQGIDKIIVLTHQGYAADRAMAAAVTGVDVIIGGHSHTFLYNPVLQQTFTPPNYTITPAGAYPTVVASPAGDPVLVVTAFEWGRFLGHLDVTFFDGIVVDYGGNPIYVSNTVVKDPVVEALIEPYRAEVNALMTLKVGEITVDAPINVDGKRICRLGECLMGNLVTDAMLWQVNTVGGGDYQIAVTNGGGLRAALLTGDVTYGGVMTVLPFGNTIATMELKGEHLLAALEHSVRSYPGENGGFLQVSGMRYHFDPSRAVGSRIIGAEVWNGTAYEPLDPDTIYKIVTNNFTRNGGDGYTWFRDDAINPYDFGPGLHEAVIDYFATFSPVTPVIEGRINKLDKVITILHTNDTHGNWVASQYGGMVRVGTLIEEQRALNPGNTILLDAGDTLQGNAFAFFFKDRPDNPIVGGMNLLNYDAMVIGNHEYNFGPTTFVTMLQQANFPLLGSANVEDDGSYGLAAVNAVDYITLTVGGKDIVIYGLTNPRVPRYELPSNIPGLTFHPATVTAIADVPAIIAAEDPDLFIALNHIGYAPYGGEEDSDLRVAEAVAGIDVIIGAHSHTLLNPAVMVTSTVNPEGTLIAQAERYANWLGVVNIGFVGDDIVYRGGHLISSKDVTPHPALQAYLDPFIAEIDAYNATPVGTTSVPIDALAAYTQETNGANLQTDAAVWALAQDGFTVDFHLSGAMANRKIAATATVTNPATITKGDLFNLMPYENSLVALELNGAQLKEILERGYRNYWYYKYGASMTPPYGGLSRYTTCMLDISAGGIITYSDPGAGTPPNGNNVVAMSVNGTPINFTADYTYTVSSVNYIVAGSCNFNDAGETIWPLDQIVYDSQIYVRDSVIAYVPTLPAPIAPAIEGRLKFQ